MKRPGSNKPITNNMVTKAKIVKSPPNLFVLCEVKISYNKDIKKMQVTRSKPRLKLVKQPNEFPEYSTELKTGS